MPHPGERALKLRRKLLGEWLCEGDLGFIYAPRGVGKTWLALLLARALSEGGSVGEWSAPCAIKVLYVDGEMPPDLIRDRDKGLQRGIGEIEFLNHEILFERSGRVLNITSLDVQQAITKRCIETNTKLLILDNLSTVASGMKENDAYAWEMVVNNWLLDFRRRKIAVIIVHHAGRNNEMRGTSKREDAAFWIIGLDDAKKQSDDKRGARFITRFTKASRNTSEEIPAYEWHITTDSITGAISVSHKIAQSLDVFRKIIEEGVTDCTEIAAEMKVSKAAVSRMAKKAMDAGWLAKKGRDYAIIETELEPRNERNETLLLGPPSFHPFKCSFHSRFRFVSLLHEGRSVFVPLPFQTRFTRAGFVSSFTPIPVKRETNGKDNAKMDLISDDFGSTTTRRSAQ